MDDDLAKLLPEAPPPRPDRREATIAEAMRRFDGASAEPAAAPVRQPALKPRWSWSQLSRPQMGIAMSLALMAVVGLPVALMVIREDTTLQQQPAGVEHPAAFEAATPPAASQAPKAFGARSAPEAEPTPLLTPKTDRQEAPAVAPADAQTAPAAKAAQDMPVAPSAPLPPAPPAPPPPPPPTAQSQAAEAIVLTGSRIARRDYNANSPVTTVEANENASAGIVVTGSRIAAPAFGKIQRNAEVESSEPATKLAPRPAASARRGVWNVCTVADPNRSLKECGGQVASGNGTAAAKIDEGLTLAWKGDADGAIAAFGAAIEIDPKRAPAYLNRGLAYWGKGDLKRAIADFDNAVHYAPNDPRGYFHRSVALRQQGDAKRADADEEHAVYLDPRYEALVN